MIENLLADAVTEAARSSYGKLIAYLSARTRDVARAEDALSDAFLEALQRWPQTGIPDSPEAWLLTVARRQLIDAERRAITADRGADHLLLLTEELQSPLDTKLPDERLSLMFVCAHPAIDERMRAPLILQTVLGFDATTIAQAFLIAPSAMSQRLVRAKAKIRDAGIPFRVPGRDELPERIDSVLAAVYATFSAGWSDPLGVDVQRKDLADEAIWLARLIVDLLPGEPEALGLLALLLHLEARREARRVNDRFIPLMEQDTARWQTALIEEADRLLAKASQAHSIGRYQLEAAIQSAHAIRRLTGRPDWAALGTLYDRLFAITQSPVVALNRAIAIAELHGPEEALALLDGLAKDARLQDYQPYWAARAELLARLSQSSAANDAYLRAIGLEADPAIREFLEERRAASRG